MRMNPSCSNYMSALSTFSQFNEVGVSRLRVLARILLISWLFTLLICSYSDFSQTPTDRAGDVAVAHEYNGSSEHGNSAQDTDACCTIQQNLPIFFKMSDIKVPLQHLMYVLLSYVVIVQTALLVAVKSNILCTDPPDKLHHLLTANVLWPNAPPR